MLRHEHTRALGRTRGIALSGAVLAAVLLLVSPGDVRAQAKVGTTGAQFLEIGVSARAMGMAEAFTALANDVSAVYYNPAGLVYLYGPEGQLTYVRMPADVNYGYAAIGLPLESIGGVLGISAYHLNSGEIDEIDYYAIPTGRTFWWKDFSLAVSYGRYLTDRFSVGFTVKYIGEFVHDYSANGWAADVGTVYNTGFRNFKIAMAITNFGPDLNMIRDDFPLPINFRFGGTIDALQTDNYVLSVAAEGCHPSDNLEKYNSGAELTIRDMFILRAGGRFNYDVDGLTFGGGLRLPFGEESEIRVDYAYQDFGVMDEVHRFTMSFAF
ncbi:MAG TPA: PorV/PorQ family protein [candidate division Zixibacteria bacterium]|nr:PorV/PorQ family protein [candidate division Zixibacteria bacterium]MDD4917875.1 PorV/PorQ family protein [candidate division Zixibacteria bacterium]MDM7973513.1 PorV/PorQ family protein [candidate division Zixibacteria bacterium]HOD67417.1 PorV/PorQ family protein [candidate division Zixibacteria bacterium]HPM38113.1 PorV/PorQ family protein [candidate division Zixibacteria bacterium]